MKTRKIAIILAVLIAASAIATAVATSGTTLTWVKTFEVKNPEITAKIKIGDVRIVGYPVNIWVSLRIQAPITEDRNNCKYDNTQHFNESIYHITVNGTYAANLQWLNTTDNQWQQLKILQPATNVTLTSKWYTNTYVFTPTQEGQYQVVATFTTDSEIQTFTSGE